MVPLSPIQVDWPSSNDQVVWPQLPDMPASVHRALPLLQRKAQVVPPALRAG
jgi:hypothetical protein